MPVQMQLSRIIISEISDNQVVFLQEDGPRHFLIMIGMFEAASIDRRIKSEFKPSRPLTHDLVVSIAEALGAAIESVLICDMREHTYFAKLQRSRRGVD
ncbi:MAG: bifunctional nuclease domain-containing protein [Pirellulales bacterium]